MKNKIVSIIYLIIIVSLTIDVLTNSNLIMKTVQFSVNLWINNILPSLFPFFILSELLIKFGFVEFISELLKNITQKLFKVRGEGAFIFIMSMISGFPSNSKYIKELFLENKINDKEASKILMFTHFSNPLFIIGTISISFLNNKNMGIIILFSHYIGNIIIGLIIRNYHPYSFKEKVSLKKAINLMHKKQIENKEKIGNILAQACFKTFKTLFLILGVVTTFLCLTTLITNHLHLNPIKDGLLKGIFEMTQGLKYISILNLSLKWKVIISTMIISFGGLSVHMQIISILGDTEIKYLPFLIARIFHAFISGFLAFILFSITN